MTKNDLRDFIADEVKFNARELRNKGVEKQLWGVRVGLLLIFLALLPIAILAVEVLYVQLRVWEHFQR
jgi:hypothetical protein